MIAFTGFEVLRSLRNSKFLLFLVAMPVGFYLLFAELHIGGQDSHGPGPLRVMVAIAAYAATASAMYATGPELSAERGSGWLRQLFTTPLGFTRWMSAKLALALAIALPGTLAVFLTAALANGVRLPPLQWLLLLALLLAGAVSFALLGQIIGLVLDAQAASPAQVIVLFGLSFLGGVFIPAAALPHAVQTAARFTPTYHVLALGDAVTSTHPLAVTHLLGIAAAVAILAAITSLLWRRDGATGS
jgi:ABC-2 type transport system permease protein